MLERMHGVFIANRGRVETAGLGYGVVLSAHRRCRIVGERFDGVPRADSKLPRTLRDAAALDGGERHKADARGEQRGHDPDPDARQQPLPPLSLVRVAAFVAALPDHLRASRGAGRPDVRRQIWRLVRWPGRSTASRPLFSREFCVPPVCHRAFLVR